MKYLLKFKSKAMATFLKIFKNDEPKIEVNVKLFTPTNLNADASISEIAGYYRKEEDCYDEALERLSNKDENTIFSNGTSLHSAKVLSKMLQRSNRTMIIYDKDLSGDLLFKKGLIEDFKKFAAKKNSLIEIIIDSDTDKNEDVLEKLKNIPAAALKIYQLKKDTGVDKATLDKIPYFAVSDHKSFRLQKKNDDESREAIGSFNDPETAEELSSTFRSMKVISQKV